MTYQIKRHPGRRTTHMLNDLDHLIHSVWGDTSESSKRVPAVDIMDKEDEYLIEVELPGYTKDDVEISVENGIITVSKEEPESRDHEEKKSYIHRERKPQSFSRSFVLPRDASVEDIEGSMKDGVLSIVIRKRDEFKPRNIAISDE